MQLRKRTAVVFCLFNSGQSATGCLLVFVQSLVSCVRVPVPLCVCVCVCACVRALTIVSTDKILRFINTLIIYYRRVEELSIR